jgi:hypothetical protein
MVMKETIMTTAKNITAAALAAFLCACTGACATAGSGRALQSLADSGDWALAALARGGTVTEIDRAALEAFPRAFTLRFVKDGPDAGGYRLTGTAVPNRFNMPLEVRPDGTLKASPPALTMMIALNEPDVLSEREYLFYITGIKSVRAKEGAVIIESVDEAGEGVTLTFIPAAPSGGR